jgi:hypothetical protein
MEQSSTLDLIMNLMNNFYLVIFSLGTLGNLISIIIFSRKKFKNTIFSTYYRLITIYDILTLLSIIIDIYPDFKFNTNLQRVSDFFCRFTDHYNYSMPTISVWTLSVISVDRFFSIFLPFKLKLRKTKSFQLTVCILIVIYNLIFYFPLFYSNLEMVNSNNESNSSSNQFECIIFNPNGLIDWMDFFNASLIPFVVMTISNGFILMKIFHRSRKRSKMIGSDSKTNTRDIKYALTSIAMNVLFFIFNFPITLFFLVKNYINFDSDYEQIGDLINLVVSLLFYSNFALLFLTSVLSNSLFREEFIKIVNIIKHEINVLFSRIFKNFK